MNDYRLNGISSQVEETERIYGPAEFFGSIKGNIIEDESACF
jgi:hypothetical protein